MYLSCKWMRTLWHCFTVHVAKIFACSKNLVQSSLLFTNHFLLNIWNCQQRVLLYIYLSVSSVWLSDSLSDIESSVSWYVSSSVCKVTDHQQPDKHYCSQNILRYRSHWHLFFSIQVKGECLANSDDGVTRVAALELRRDPRLQHSVV